MIDNRDGQAYLDAVLEKIRQRILSINESLLEGQKEIDDMHEYYWQNYTEMDEYGYENFDNQQALLHQINANQEQLILKHRFRKMLDSPFFGRVDFCYEGDEEPEIFYIGIGNFAEKTGALPLTMTRGPLPTRLPWASFPVRSRPNGSTRSAAEK